MRRLRMSIKAIPVLYGGLEGQTQLRGRHLRHRFRSHLGQEGRGQRQGLHVCHAARQGRGWGGLSLRPLQLRVPVQHGRRQLQLRQGDPDHGHRQGQKQLKDGPHHLTINI